MDQAADFAVSIVILPALRKVEGSERSLPAVAQMGPHKSTASRAWGIGASTPWWPSAMGDNFVSIVILSERSESKDLYLMQHARMHAEAEFAQAVDPMEVLRHEQQSEEGQNDHSAQACL